MTPDAALDLISGRRCRVEGTLGGLLGISTLAVTKPSQPPATLPGVASVQVVPTQPYWTVKLYNPKLGAPPELGTATVLKVGVELDNGYWCISLTGLQLVNPDPVIFRFDPTNVTVMPISDKEFKELEYPRVLIDWAAIKIPAGGKTRDYAFEELCRELLVNPVNPYANFSFLGPGPDSGRDGAYTVSVSPFPSIRVETPCIMQCKYSDDVTRNLGKTEVYEEVIKVTQYDPRYYVLVTNRNITQGFDAWFTAQQKQMRFQMALVNREVLEELLRQNLPVLTKYFDL